MNTDWSNCCCPASGCGLVISTQMKVRMVLDDCKVARMTEDFFCHAGCSWPETCTSNLLHSCWLVPRTIKDIWSRVHLAVPNTDQDHLIAGERMTLHATKAFRGVSWLLWSVSNYSKASMQARNLWNRKAERAHLYAGKRKHDTLLLAGNTLLSRFHNNFSENNRDWSENLGSQTSLMPALLWLQRDKSWKDDEKSHWSGYAVWYNN